MYGHRRFEKKKIKKQDNLQSVKENKIIKHRETSDAVCTPPRQNHWCETLPCARHMYISFDPKLLSVLRHTPTQHHSSFESPSMSLCIPGARRLMNKLNQRRLWASDILLCRSDPGPLPLCSSMLSENALSSLWHQRRCSDICLLTWRVAGGNLEASYACLQVMVQACVCVCVCVCVFVCVFVHTLLMVPVSSLWTLCGRTRQRNGPDEHCRWTLDRK